MSWMQWRSLASRILIWDSNALYSAYSASCNYIVGELLIELDYPLP